MDPHFAGAYSYMAMDSTVGHQCDLSNPLPGKKSMKSRKIRQLEK